MKKLRIAVLISGEGSNLQAIINGIKNGQIQGEISLIMSDRENAQGLKRAEKENIDAFTILKSDYSSWEKWNREVLGKLQSYQVDLVLLAGFMSILDWQIIQRFSNAIINIHPSLIPSFCGRGFYGKRVHQGVLDYGVKVTGVTVHFVDEGADTGPIILQEVVKVHQGDDVESLSKRVLEVEHRLYPKAVELFAQGKLQVQGRKVNILGENQNFKGCKYDKKSIN